MRDDRARVSDLPSAGWYPDPDAHHQVRYWDGGEWTAHVADDGVQLDDPLASATAAVDTSPSAPSETAPVSTPVSVSAAPAAIGSAATVPADVPGTNPALVLAVLAAGAAFAVFLGAYAHVHDPTGETTLTLFFTSTLNLKVWFTTVALVFALVQVLTAARLYGKVHIPRRMPKWLGDFHRLAGSFAFAFTLPVAFHCLWSLGFVGQLDDTRRFVHSIAGCAFFGLFVVKVLSVRVRRLPGWLLPTAGSLLFGVLVVVWATSSLWFFQNVAFPGV